MKKVFKIADIRKLERMLIKEEISYSRMVEIMNEMANNALPQVKKLIIPDVSGTCEHPMKELIFWNTGYVECKKCGYKTVPF